MSAVQRFTGAAARGTAMVIITVRVEGESFVLCEDASARLVMHDRSQGEIRQFAEDLNTFVQRSGVRKIVLRAAPGRGDYAAHPRIYKMEAALQLHPKLEVALVTPATLLKWVGRSSSKAPSVHSSVTTASEEALHQEAMRAAFLSASGFSEGSSSKRVK